jgi:acyl-CoA thioester hydrolase
MRTLPESMHPYEAVVDVPVAWGDMDAFGHVNNTRYFRYFETARIEFFAGFGFLGQGVGPILAATSCRFRAPVVFPDTLRVGSRVVSVGEDRFTLEHAAYSEKLDRIAAIGEAVVVSYDYAAGSKVALPPEWKAALAARVQP